MPWSVSVATSSVRVPSSGAADSCLSSRSLPSFVQRYLNASISNSNKMALQLFLRTYQIIIANLIIWSETMQYCGRKIYHLCFADDTDLATDNRRSNCSL